MSLLIKNKISIALLLFICFACKQEKEKTDSSNQPLPNILLFLADDMTWRDCQPYGNPDVHTPNIQRMADAGMIFHNMFTATAMCAPTRQQLYTGLFPARSGAYPNHSQVKGGVKSLGHYFKTLGYNVALIGKQHYGPEASFPFEYLGGRGGDNGKNGPDIELDKIDGVVNGNQPFFLIVAQNQPHLPWNRGNPAQYNADSLTVPPYLVDSPFTRKELTKYYAEITHMDSLLGVCLDKVEMAGKTANTLSIFTSEQGATHPFAKWTCYDRGLKTAFIAQWSGKIKAGSSNAAIAQYVDVVPTLLEMAGVQPDTIDTGVADANGFSGFDGKSFWKVLTSEKSEHAELAFGIHTTRGVNNGSSSYPVRSVRNKRFRYIRNLVYTETFYNNESVLEGKHYTTWMKNVKDASTRDWLKRYQTRPYEELYDIQNDPWEMVNLAESKEFEAVKDSMAIQLEAWMEQQGDQGVETELKALERMGQHHVETWKAFQPQ